MLIRKWNIPRAVVKITKENSLQQFFFISVRYTTCSLLIFGFEGWNFPKKKIN